MPDFQECRSAIDLACGESEQTIGKASPENTSQQQRVIAKVGMKIDKELGVPDKNINMMT
jgi:hypothetical protein